MPNYLTENTVVGFTAGVWDFLHPGHILFLEDCKSQCDELIVGLQTTVEGRDDKNVPVQSVLERYLQLNACRYVDQIIPYSNEKDLELLLHSIECNVRFLGTDYLEPEANITGYQICTDRNIRLSYINRSHWLSSSELRARIENSK